MRAGMAVEFSDTGAIKERQTTPRPDADVAADTEDEPEQSQAPGTEVTTRCLKILQAISDGFDPRDGSRSDARD